MNIINYNQLREIICLIGGEKMQFYSEADITANIKAERARSGLSQEDVAEKLGITRQSYNIWETNPKSLTLDKIELLAKVIGCSVTTLVIK